MQADLVLKNSNVITMNARRPTAQAIAIAGNKILLAGSNDEAEAVTGPKTKIIDCRGKTIVPGFNDAHCHLFSFIRKLISLDVGPSSVSSIADIKEAVRRQAAKTPPGRWISGTGFNEFYLVEKRYPTRHDLDEVAPEHPVVLSHRSLHACVLNSKALSLAGITIETPDPPGGLIEREVGTGEPNGILFEMVGYIRDKVMPPLTREELAEGLAKANENYLSNGITSFQEASVNNDYHRWELLRWFKDNGKLRSRVYMMLGAESRGQFQEAGLATGSGDRHLRLGAVKIILSEATGELKPSQAELNEIMLESHRAGFQVATHAIRENMVASVVASLEYVKSREPQPDRRHRVEHCSECPPDLMERLSRLKAVVATQPPFLHYSGDRYLATIPAEHQPWLYRFKSLLDAGLKVAGSSDSPVVDNSPLAGMYAAITRKTTSGQFLLPHEAISPRQALAMYTTNAAYASGEERVKGSIAPGKLADLVVLSGDPLHEPTERIKDIKVEMTIIDGKIAWEG